MAASPAGAARAHAPGGAPVPRLDLSGVRGGGGGAAAPGSGMLGGGAESLASGSGRSGHATYVATSGPTEEQVRLHLASRCCSALQLASRPRVCSPPLATCRPPSPAQPAPAHASHVRFTPHAVPSYPQVLSQLSARSTDRLFVYHGHPLAAPAHASALAAAAASLSPRSATASAAATGAAAAGPRGRAAAPGEPGGAAALGGGAAALGGGVPAIVAVGGMSFMPLSPRGGGLSARHRTPQASRSLLAASCHAHDVPCRIMPCMHMYTCTMYTTIHTIYAPDSSGKPVTARPGSSKSSLSFFHS